MKKTISQVLSIALALGFATALAAEDNVCVKYQKKMHECMVKEFAKPCKKNPKCSMCQSVNPTDEMKKSMEEGYASMPCEGEEKIKAEKNLKLSCAKDKSSAESLKSMKQAMKSMPDCK